MTEEATSTAPADVVPAPDPVAPGSLPGSDTLALVLSGGGARAAYQAGLVAWLARNFPELRIPIVTGVSAGAVNAASLAQHHGTLRQAASELVSLWSELTPERVFRVDVRWLARNVGRWGVGLLSGGARRAPQVRGLLDTEPLREFLHDVLAPVEGELTGVDFNLHRGTLRAVALSATSYTTGQSVLWVQGRELAPWRQHERRVVRTRICVDHVMASTALPFIFPAVRVGNEWFGDGGMRQTAPLSPALHLGANRILTVSTRHHGARAPAAPSRAPRYPPPAQILGVLYNAVFLDAIDEDVGRLSRLNQVITELPEARRDGLRLVRLLVLRPSCNLGALARDFEPRLPRPFRMLSRGLGTRQAENPELLSMLMFQADYLRRLVELGEADAEARAEEIEEFLNN